MKVFQRKQDLLRHLRHNHASEWNRMETLALDVLQRHQMNSQCYCRPEQYKTKHICAVFLQYALMRLLQHRDTAPSASGAAPPDVQLTSAQHVEQLVWTGHMKFVYKMPALKRNLTMHCQLCNYTGADGDELLQHLEQAHAEQVKDAEHVHALLRWTLFQSLGCACNPTRAFGAPGHVCTSLLQIAVLCTQVPQPLILPWTFRTNELISFLGDILPLQDMQRIAHHLVTRKFDALWTDGALVRLLKSHCIICGELTQFHRIKAHLRVAHQFTFDKAQAVILQLSAIYAAEHSDGWHCDHCGELIPSILTEDDTVIQPDKHLPNCPFILHMAALLMHPVLLRLPYEPNHWPTPQVGCCRASTTRATADAVSGQTLRFSRVNF